MRIGLLVVGTAVGLVLFAAPAAVAQTTEDRAKLAAAADVTTTAGALALGAAEANPLGVGALLLKPVALQWAASLPEDERADAYATIGSVWGGAAANNLCVMAAILSGGGFAPACLIAGVAWGMNEWNRSAMERELWAICRAERAYWNNPTMTCDFFGKSSPVTNTAAAR